SGKGSLTPTKIQLTGAKATIFDGSATGNLTWNVPKPTQTNIDFSGKLNGLKADSFFQETSFLGGDSNIHKYLEGALSAEVQYSSSLEPTLTPKVSTIQAQGAFGMTTSRLKDHPIQMEIAKLLKVDELKNVALDDWETTFAIEDELLRFNGLNLTSKDIGIEMQGTHHLVSDVIDYKATIALPGRFKKGIANVISENAANALQQENGTIAIPLIISGTSEKPKVRPDQDVIKKVVEDYLKDKGSDLIKGLFNGN
ncbi:MAG: AsmA-like C-terminal region-containing protein, partial [Gracilimonas sp.]|nr:AsmA-like C-terminal region-containing protein [Gracilimonas sp.]